MSTEAPRQLEVVRSPAEMLEAATDAVRLRLQDLLRDPTVGSEDAEAFLGSLATRIQRGLEDPQEPDDEDVYLSSHPLFGPMLDAVSRELIHSPTDRQAALSTLEVLRAVSALRSPGDASAGGDRSDDLRRTMREPDAFELLIEVAHDFRSPLTSILFLSETLRDGHSGDVSDLQRSQLGLMYSAAFGLASVASDIMDLARREKDLIDDEAEPYGLAEVFQNVQRLVNPIVEEKGLDFRIVCPDRMQAVGHPHALSRVLLNLTTNALKFTDEGSVEVGVRGLPRARLEFYVHDTGRGIPTERLHELFQPFKRRLGQSQEGHFFSGSGVGLSIARRLVRAMGSELDFETSDDRGTRFWFVVPAAPAR